mmetsp:Transcript_920/g.2004  ORF Transcript_920/g.2004 Transcript_920/m.2004 type:complete len:1150 (-) Transcript_920:131-3580(-)
MQQPPARGAAGGGPLRFPRTAHLAGRGAAAATSDDVVLSARETDLLLSGGEGDNIVISEKVDGANIGLSLDPSTGSISVTNRSHAADLSPGSQFSKLPGWLEQHEDELVALLSQGYILYGEWLQVKHTVPYGGLPDWFLAFDIYDIESGVFLATARRDQLLKQSAPSIYTVPQVPRGGACLTREGLLELLRATRSAFRTDGGTPEGFVVRVEHGGVLRTRGKLVLPEFKQSIDASGHWMHLQRVLNAVRPDLWPASDGEEGEAEDGIEDLLQEARDLGRAREYERALRASEQACGMRSGSAEAEGMRAQCLFGLERWEEAKASFQACIAKGAEGALAGKCERALGECARRMNRQIAKEEEKELIVEGEAEKGLGTEEKQSCSWLPDTVLTNPRERSWVSTTLGNVALMRNTSWVVANCLLGASTPKSLEHVVALREALGITLVVTLTEEEPLDASWFAADRHPPRSNLFCPVPNTKPPTLNQAHSLMKAMEAEAARGGRFLVHCGGGKGRAGTVIACWLVKHGFTDGMSWDGTPAMGAEEAVAVLRAMRPGSIETEDQRLFVSKFCSDLWKRCAAAPETVGAAPETGNAAPKTVNNAAPTIVHDTPKPFEATPEAVCTAAPTRSCAVEPAQAEGGEQAPDGKPAHARVAAPSSLPAQYPRTPHVHFSPGATDDDVTLQAPSAGARTRMTEDSEVVVTEKLDGGNCCITHDGRVFARTHSKEATHPWFSAAKEIAGRIRACSALPEGVCLFCENMEAVHSIDYGRLSSPLYVIVAVDNRSSPPSVLSWHDTRKMARAAGVPTVPELFRGSFSSHEELEAWSRGAMALPSRVGTAGSPREGWVVRPAASFVLSEFRKVCAKYVRGGHRQTTPDFRRTWRRAEWSQEHCDSGSDDAAAGGDVAERGSAAVASSGGGKHAASGSRPDDASASSGEESAGPTAAAQAGTAARRPGAKKGVGKGRDGSSSRAPPRLVMLVGIPGSGKSTFSRLLLEQASAAEAAACAAGEVPRGPGRRVARFVHLNQDVIRGRRACEDAVGHELLRGRDADGKCVVLDRCNCAKSDRAEWLALAMQAARHCVCVFFDCDAAVCVKRVAAREDHPTIPKGRGGKAVASHAKMLEVPTAAEGFARVFTVSSDEEAGKVALQIVKGSF